MKCKPEITPILKWFGQMTYIHLRGPSSMRLPPSTSKSLEMEGQIPLLQPFTSSSTFYKFSARKKEENSLANWKQDLLRLSKTFLSIKILLKSCNLSWDLRGIYRPQEDSNFGLQNLNSLRVSDAGGATAQLSGAGWCNRPAQEVSPPSSPIHWFGLILAQTKSDFGPSWPLTRI